MVATDMKRVDFLKKLGIGLGAVVVAPQVLASMPAKEKPKSRESMTAQEYHIDNCSMVNNTPKDILKHYRETGNLLYSEGHHCINDLVYINNDKDKYVIRLQIEDGVYGIEKI